MFSLSVEARNARMAALVATLGAGATAKPYNGTKPSALGVPAGAVLATLTFGSDVTAANGGSAGGIANGTLTFGGYTQTPSTFVAGTATFIRFSKANGTPVADVDIGTGPGNAQISAAIAPNQSLTGAVVLTDGNLAS